MVTELALAATLVRQTVSHQQPNPATERVALSQELSEFLIEFAIALHRTSMYPEGHPSQERSAGMVVRRLSALLLERPSISLGVARDQLVIEGVLTDPRHPVLRTLAERLHRHQLGAVVLERGTDVEAVNEVLRALAVEPDIEGGTPLGLGDRRLLERWRHIHLYPLGYEQLELVGEGAGEELPAEERERATSSAQLWVGLARAALATEDRDAPVESAEPGVVAEAINQHPAAQAYDQVIVGYLLQLAEELRREGGMVSSAVRKRLSRLVGALDEGTLQRLIGLGADITQRRQFVLDASEVLAAEAVVDVVQAAASASHRAISDPMLRLLTKLSAFAEQGSQPVQIEAGNALREQVQQLVSNWDLEDPSPGEYASALTGLSRRLAAPSASADTSFPPEPLRLVQMAIEADTVGVPVWRALDELADGAGLGALVEVLAEAPSDNHTVAALWDRLATPERLRRLLAAESVDFRVLDPVIARLAPADRAPVLMDTLFETESRSTRVAVFKRLAAMELPVLEPHILRGIADARWYVQRNMLALLNELQAWSDAVPASELAYHPDPRVRREALVLWLRSPEERERALLAALADPDERALRAGIAAAGRRAPDAAIGLVARRALEPLPVDVRAALLQLLAGHRHPHALDALLRTAATGRSLLGRYRLAPRSPATLAAISVLSRTWALDRNAAAVLTRARASDDPEIRAAAGPALP